MIEGMSNAHYHKAKAISRSYLQGLRTVPAGALVDFTATGSMNFGTAAHTRLLEPHLYDELVIESINKTSNGKDFQELVEHNPDKCVLLFGGKEKVEKACQNALLHPKAKELLSSKSMIPEPSFFWKDEEYNLWCKTRPDFVDFDNGVMGDLKFVSKGKADARRFTWSCRDFGYDLQAAWNIFGVKQVTGILIKQFWFVVVETDEPYRVSCYELDPEWLGDSLWECRNLLGVEADCREKNFWPNYVEDNADGEIIYRGI